MSEITDQQYRATEGRLYRYFRQLPRLQRIEAIINELETQRATLHLRIEEGLRLKPPSAVASYSDMPPSGNNNTSPLERSWEKAEDALEALHERYAEAGTKLLELEVERGRLREYTVEVTFALSLLDEEEAAIVRQRYNLQRSHYQIAQVLNCGATTVRRRVSEIVEKVAGVLEQGVAQIRRKSGANPAQSRRATT